MKKLDELVVNSLNPYTIVRMVSSNTEEQECCCGSMKL